MRFVTLIIKNSNNSQVIRFVVSKISSSSDTFQFLRKHVIKLRYKILYSQKFKTKTIFTNVQHKESLSKGITKKYN